MINAFSGRMRTFKKLASSPKSNGEGGWKFLQEIKIKGKIFVTLVY